MAVEPGSRIEVVIEKAVFRGLGLARHDGQVVLVRGAYPGERWGVRINEVGKQLMRGEAEQPLETVAERRASPCPSFPECGGCTYQDLEYGAQLELKRAVLTDALGRAHVSCADEIPVEPSREMGWRSRAALHVGTGGAGAQLGLMAAGSRRVVDLPACLQLSDALNGVVGGLRTMLRRQPAIAGRVQRVELAESGDGTACVAVLVGDLGRRELGWLAGAASDVVGLSGLGVVDAGSARPRLLPVTGEMHVESHVAGVSLRSHVGSFFQANRFLLDALVAEVNACLPVGGLVWDLYGGVGLFGLPLAERAESVISVEIDPLAVEDARVNVERAGCANVRLVRADVRRALADEPARAEEHVVVDPPRTGLADGVVAAIARRGPQNVVYVSCDPPTLGRDLARFAALGYSVARIKAFDLFPDTFHIEALAHLVRAK